MRSLDPVLASLPVEPAWVTGLLALLLNPVVATLLISLGILGLLIEIKAGAHGLGLLVGLLAFGLLFGASILLGLAGWPVLLLLALGLTGLLLEVLPLPTFGVAGITGLLMLFTSVLLALAGRTPSSSDLLQALAVLAASLVLTMSVVYAWVRHLPNSTRFRGLIHQGGATSADGFVAAPARHDLIGREGKAMTDLRPAGVALVDGERIDVVTEGEYIPSGSPVRVLRAESYRHVVQALALPKVTGAKDVTA
jgi:membrane-bound serine protease (ClpP class)